MDTYLKRLVEERTNLTSQITSTADKAAKEERDMTATEQTAVAGMQKRAIEIDGLLKQHSEQADAIRSFAELRAKIEEQGKRQESSVLSGGESRTSEVEAPVFDGAEFRGYKGGRSAPAEFGSILPGLEERADFTTSDLEDIIPVHQFTPAEAMFRTPLLGVVGIEPVSTGFVEWVKWSDADDAGTVPEGTQKPEAEFAPELTAASLDTYAHWKGITRQALEDATRIRSIMENKLRRGVLSKIETEVGNALTGGTYDVIEEDDLISSIRVAIASQQDKGWNPTAVALNPLDWAALDIQLTAGSRGLTDVQVDVDIPDPASLNVGAGQRPNTISVAEPIIRQSFWGLRVVASSAVASGTAYVGDFRAGITYFDRGRTSVYVSDSHAGNFLSNVLVMLAETRGLPVVTEAEAIAECGVAAPAAAKAKQSK